MVFGIHPGMPFAFLPETASSFAGTRRGKMPARGDQNRVIVRVLTIGKAMTVALAHNSLILRG